MRVEDSKVEALTIYEAERLDPILVMMQDFGGGRGRLIVECWGEAWSSYWGAMGDDTGLKKFVVGCHPDYIVNRMWGPNHKRAKHGPAYLARIIRAVQEALRAQVQHSGPQQP